MKTIGTIMLLAMITLGTVIPAYYTGNSHTFISVTGQPGIACEFKMGNGQKFWRNFSGYVCPVSVEVY